jgi:hypothetical protein
MYMVLVKGQYSTDIEIDGHSIQLDLNFDNASIDETTSRWRASNGVHIMSVGVSFNDQGAVDTVYLSKILSQEISQLLKPSQFIAINYAKSDTDNKRYDFLNKVN